MSAEFSISKRPILTDLPDNRDDLIYLATLAASGGRFEHMYDYMKKLVQIVGPKDRLNAFERKCFSWACNGHMKDKHEAFLQVAKFANDWAVIDLKRSQAANSYLPIMAIEINGICRDVLNTINFYLMDPVYGRLRSHLAVEPIIFYSTMKGDFLRFLSEINSGAERRRLANEAYDCFLSAKREEYHLPPTNLTRLHMRFSLANFMCDVLQKPFEAYRIAQEGYEYAMADLKEETPSEEQAAILGHLHDLLSLWSEYAT